MSKYFEGLDFSDFWNDCDYSLKEYVQAAPTPELIVSVEAELGYKLPGAYIALMNMHNGGIPNKTCFPCNESTSWADDHIAISGIMGIGRAKQYALCGSLGNRFMIEEWCYPEIGICICDCPSAGHDMIMLDYRKCGSNGEPEVVHVDQESDYRITFLAKDFETFIKGLVHEDVYDTSEEDYLIEEQKINNATFSGLLQTLCDRFSEVPGMEKVIRKISIEILEEKKCFALHADELSSLLYDIQFLLFSNSHTVPTKKEYLDRYPDMIAFGGAFSTGGYAPAFIDDWFEERMKHNAIIKTPQGYLFSPTYRNILAERIKKYQ